MSTEAVEATPNRKQRRLEARQGHSVKDQRFASLMVKVFDDGKLPRRESETDADYFRRIRKFAKRVQHEQSKAKRKAAHDARVQRQKTARANRRKNR